MQRCWKSWKSQREISVEINNICNDLLAACRFQSLTKCDISSDSALLSPDGEVHAELAKKRQRSLDVASATTVKSCA
jgi:hypothetical protein